jgi:hypothetical protein
VKEERDDVHLTGGGVRGPLESGGLPPLFGERASCPPRWVGGRARYDPFPPIRGRARCPPSKNALQALSERAARLTSSRFALLRCIKKAGPRGPA